MMKKRICIIFVLCIVFLEGCDSSTSHNDCVRVAIMPGASCHILFSITDEKTVEISTLKTPIVNIKNDDFTYKLDKTKTISLSETDANEIKLLVKALKESENYGEDYPIISIGGDEVQACVDDKLYRSMYQANYFAPNLETVNTALLDLTYKLIELSPMDIGVEQIS